LLFALAAVCATMAFLAACGGGSSSQPSGTNTTPTLASIAVTPSMPSIALGTTKQFVATGTYSNGSTQVITGSVTWSSSNSDVATISNTAGSQGLASPVNTGTATITATSGTITGSTSLTVTGIVPALVSITIAPTAPTISQLATEQFTATGTYSDGSTQNLTNSATWQSSDTSVATISNTSGSQGLATTANPGNTTITATSGSVSGSTVLTVTAATLQSIAVSPLSQTIAQGATQQFTATGTYSDGTMQTLTTSVAWKSSNTSIATISNTAGSQGLASGVGGGTATITATSGSVSGTATLTVTAPTLVSIAVTPQSPSILVDKTQQFTATGTYSDSTMQNITDSVTWSSETTSVATISNSSGSQGLATGVNAGTSKITATLGTITGSTTLTVTASVSSQSWTLHGPVARQSHTAVYDPTSQQMIIFGGVDELTGADLNDVWLGTTQANEDDAFTGESPTGTAPEARYGHVATYDSVSNRMTIFGGGSGPAPTCLSDAWILSAANGQGSPSWISVSPATTPQARLYSGAAYDPNTNSMMVFGGSNCSGGYFNDVWVLSDANGEAGTPNWTKLTPTGGPPAARESGSAVYDSTDNILTIYGGDAGGSPFGDVWVLSHANGTGGTPVWTQLSPTGTAPMTRTGQTAVYDSANDRMIVFGGINSGTTLADTWVLTSANGIGGAPAWTEINTPSTAPSLAYHSAVYDAASNNMYAFAGLSSQSKLGVNDHAFTLTAANGLPSGNQNWVLGGPPVRYGQSAFYDSSTNGLFVFAGEHALSAINFNDYWEQAPVIGSTNLQWTAVTMSGSRPSGRWGQTGLYDSGSNRMMVFGGATGFPAPCANDYYVMEHANTVGGTPNWLAITPGGTAPPVRTLQASAYDSTTNTIMIFGGYNCTSTYYNDVWILSNANAVSGTPTWTALSPTGTPPSQRESASAIYDPTTNSLVVYGGDAGGAPFGDIFTLSHANGSGGIPAWTQLTPTTSGPGARSGHTATYDATNNIMMIYGGYDSTNILGDTWVLSNANGQGGAAVWTQTLTGQPRRFHSSEYDPNSNQMITYGGTTGVTTQAPTSDVYTLADANDLP